MTSGANRRLATILFLDIVGSTPLAHDLGEHRWPALLSRFRKTVRADLKRFGGHEEDTTGDGFFATFAQPAAGVRCAAAIANDVRELGLEIRTGLHTGECEVSDGKLEGIAVHIAARVMSEAGAGEIVITSTVKDLVVGSAIGFEDLSEHELKGVPGPWRLFGVRDIDGAALAPPLTGEQAAERLALVEAPPQRRRTAWLVAACLLVVGVAGAMALVGRNDRGTAAGPPPTPVMLRIDPSTNQIAGAPLHDRYYSHHIFGAIGVVKGVLWQGTPHVLLQRDPTSGTPGTKMYAIGDNNGVQAVAFGFGSAWIAYYTGGTEGSLVRVNQVSLEPDGAPVDVAGADRFGDFLAAGDGSIWYLEPDGSVDRINPRRGRVIDRYDDPAGSPGAIYATGGYVWICDCPNHRVVRLDPHDGKTEVFDVPQSAAALLGVPAADGTITLWLVDPQNSTLTPIDPRTGEQGAPVGVGGEIRDVKMGFGALWVAGGDQVLRIDLANPSHVVRIDMPSGFSAGGIAPDPATDTVWVQNCGCFEA